MAGTTENYGLAVGVVTDDIVEPDHHNRVAATLDRVLGGVIRNLMADGAHEGWLLNLDGEVTAGEGLVAGCWCRTTEAAATSGLTNSATNHVFARTNSGSAPDGTVEFVAQLTAEKPEGAVYLGTVEVDAGGAVTAVDNDADGVDRNCFSLEISEISDSGVLEGFYGLSEGEMALIEVEHAAEGEFAWTEPPRMADAPGVAFLLDAGYTNGSRFRVWAMRTDDVGGGWTGPAAADLEYAWTRLGGLR
ncbi:MAG: hypothetical protein KKI08_23610 [Armatimonadetes bacterium]|nr:hypothetical protein [Armatimonadota bacterium]